MSAGEIMPSFTSVLRNQSIRPAQNGECTRMTGIERLLRVWISVSASISSSTVPKPPGITT